MTEGFYKECGSCPVKAMCKVYSGEVTPTYTDWCRGKYKVDAAMAMTEIQEEYQEAYMENFDITEHNKAAYETLKGITDDVVANIDAGNNYFIFGKQTGTGKTHAAHCILNHYILKTCMTSRFDFENPLALYVFYPELMHELRYNRDDEDLDRKINMIKNVPLLLLDDVGAGTMSEFSREQTTLILNHRINRKLSTIVTTNFTLKQLREETRLGTRIASRLTKRATGIEMSGGPDRRMFS